MKKITTLKRQTLTIISLAGLLLLFSSFNSFKKKDCNPLVLLEEAVKKLKKFTLVKDYQFNFKEKKKKGPIESLSQTITLNRGVRYKFLAVPNPDFEGKPIVTIFNNEKKEFMVASTFSNATQSIYEHIEFECKTTGNYCLTFYFKDGLEGCAVGVHSFLKE